MFEIGEPPGVNGFGCVRAL